MLTIDVILAGSLVPSLLLLFIASVTEQVTFMSQRNEHKLQKALIYATSMKESVNFCHANFSDYSLICTSNKEQTTILKQLYLLAYFRRVLGQNVLENLQCTFPRENRRPPTTLLLIQNTPHILYISTIINLVPRVSPLAPWVREWERPWDRGCTILAFIKMDIKVPLTLQFVFF